MTEQRSVTRRVSDRLRPYAAAARMYAERHAVPTMHRRRSTEARILCYHSVGTPEMGVNDVVIDRFRRQIETALAAGYRFSSARELAAGHVEAKTLAVTFDDGFRSVAKNAAPVLAEYAIPWTIFVVGMWADGLHPLTPELFLDWDELVALGESGVTIGCHSMTHPDFGRIRGQQVVDELVDSRELIVRQTGLDVREFAIPFGQSRNWSSEAATAAVDAGYDVIYAQSDRGRPAGTVPRTFITRFDGDRIFRAALGGAFAGWEEWY